MSDVLRLTSVSSFWQVWMMHLHVSTWATPFKMGSKSIWNRTWIYVFYLFHYKYVYFWQYMHKNLNFVKTPLKFKCDFGNTFTPFCSGYLCLAWRKHVQPSIVNCFFDIFCSLRWYVRPYPTLPNNSSGIIITFSRFYHLKLRPVNVYYVHIE